MRGPSLVVFALSMVGLVACKKTSRPKKAPAPSAAASRVPAASKPVASKPSANRPDFVLELERFLVELERLAAQVDRSERSGHGDGRVETVSFPLINLAEKPGRRKQR